MAIHCCKDCYAQFKNAGTYFSHRRKKHSRFSCANCGKAFGLRKKFKNHSRVCLRFKKSNKPTDNGSIISLLDYKRLPVVTAEELDSQFNIYIDRKFSKKGVFRNEKMCKFCCKIFSIASKFADHIREHYNTIPLDATGVKSKFDFMKFMGLKIKEANDTTDCSDGNSVEHSERILANRITECKVVVVGERCKICDEPFKCITDLNLHNKKQHSQHRRNKVTLVLRIGEEIMSKIPLSRRHIRRSDKIQSQSRRLKNSETIEIHKAPTKRDKNMAVNSRRTEVVAWSRGESPSDDCTYDAKRSCCWELQERNNSQPSAMRSEKKWGELYSRDTISEPHGNTMRCSETRRNKYDEVGLDSLDKARNTLSLYDAGSRGDKGTCELESREMYADEYFDNMQFAEPWKDEIVNDNLSWYSTAESETEARQRMDDEKDEDRFCIETIEPRLLPQIKSAWEEENFQIMNQDSRNCHEISLNGFTSVRKYSSDLKYQNDFSFSSDEESYDFQVQDHPVKKNNDDDEEDDDDDDDSIEGDIYGVKKPGKMVSGYPSTIIAQEERKNVNVSYSRSFAHPSEDESFVYQEHRILGTGKDALDRVTNHPTVFIKEEIILDDCTFCIDDDYSSTSNFSS